MNMEITLRKANALQSEIRKAISSSGVTDTVAVNEYTSDIAGGVEKAKADYAGDIMRKVALNHALFNIRKSVAQANATAGISDILADVQTIDAVMAVYSGVATKAVAKTIDEITARVEKMKAAPADTSARSALYGDHYNKVDTSVVDQSTIDMAKAKVKELKRQKQTLQDKLLTLNVNTSITISDVDTNVLKVEGII
jgi:hypothetical protein